ncbi:hypothetical protein PYW07_011059 [Mythimna separata]|uniref:MADF domain-containing protein n=1 Tax=Mythimna separata TaxID=271217 RepID=A0AAD7Y770_MYTSE|nr:hypothetical protein PYW07_011059 [Mythimna separata]
MREFKYNVIDLISYVRDRPCLWDKTIENYKDRMERRSAWEEIFNNLDEAYEELAPEEKRITGEMILHKWTNIRDTFLKSLKTRMGKPKKKYLLYDHLQFLTKVLPESERPSEINNSNSSFMKQEELDSGFSITAEIAPESSTSFAISNETSFGSKKNVKANDFDDAKSTDYASEASYSRKNGRAKRKNRFIFVDDTDSSSSRKKTKKNSTINDDVSVNDQLSAIDFVEVDNNDPRIMNEDEAFFASLLPTVVKYTEDERLEFRIEVLGVMKKLKDKRTWMAE